MNNRKWFFVINLLALVLILIFAWLHVREILLLNDFISDLQTEIKEINQPQDVFKLRDEIYFLINDGGNSKRLKRFNVNDRPLNGYSITFVIKNREGQCGEFTRLMYRILRKGGIKSRPVILYGLGGNMHSVLEVLLPGTTPFLVDTNNSVPGLHELFLKRIQPLNSYVYEVNDYKTAVLIDMHPFQLFSYFNITKLSHPITGINSYRTKPIPDWVNWLYASVYLSYILITLLGAIVANTIIAVILVIRKRHSIEIV